ncbi:hypothetical protein ACL7TT_20440 [Microbulbifer sp. 2304DJ12-6]|uniref:hypothetical protein n=1 Tax=Microbulbifer sp. 2304DJ12-6 TaxID=3233340 RepID=UPI0039B07764
MAGGGSGGGIILAALLITGSPGSVTARGGGPAGGAGTGAGGRILVLNENAEVPTGISFNVNPGGINATVGVLEFGLLEFSERNRSRY